MSKSFECDGVCCAKSLKIVTIRARALCDVAWDGLVGKYSVVLSAQYSLDSREVLNMVCQVVA